MSRALFTDLRFRSFYSGAEERSSELFTGADTESLALEREMGYQDAIRNQLLGEFFLRQKTTIRPKDNLRVSKRGNALLSEDVVSQIMLAIEKGDLRPGQRLPAERELCIRFGIARSSLREALRCLAIIGVLHARVGEGTMLAPNGQQFLKRILQWRILTEQHDLHYLLEVRIALEGIAAANVARRRAPEAIRELVALSKKMKECTGDLGEFQALDLQFHIKLAHYSGNPLLADLISIMRGHTAAAISRMVKTPNAMPLINTEHARLIRAIRKGDAESARIAVQTHLSNAVGRYEQAHDTGVEAFSPAKRRSGKSISKN